MLFHLSISFPIYSQFKIDTSRLWLSQLKIYCERVKCSRITHSHSFVDRQLVSDKGGGTDYNLKSSFKNLFWKLQKFSHWDFCVRYKDHDSSPDVQKYVTYVQIIFRIYLHTIWKGIRGQSRYNRLARTLLLSRPPIASNYYVAHWIPTTEVCFWKVFSRNNCVQATAPLFMKISRDFFCK